MKRRPFILVSVGNLWLFEQRDLRWTQNFGHSPDMSGETVEIPVFCSEASTFVSIKFSVDNNQDC
jgi:hypothetical protein